MAGASRQAHCLPWVRGARPPGAGPAAAPDCQGSNPGSVQPWVTCLLVSTSLSGTRTQWSQLQGSDSAWMCNSEPDGEGSPDSAGRGQGAHKSPKRGGREAGAHRPIPLAPHPPAIPCTLHLPALHPRMDGWCTARSRWVGRCPREQKAIISTDSEAVTEPLDCEN